MSFVCCNIDSSKNIKTINIETLPLNQHQNNIKRSDVGSDQKKVTILEKSFIAPNGEKANLDYPADRPDQYYMTLFAKKFAQPEKSSVSMNN